MDISQLVAGLTPEVYENLRTSVETGKWPDGKALTQGQKEHSLQLVMAYQSKVLKSTEHFTIGETGELINKPKRELKQQFSKEQNIARFNHDDI